MISTTTTTTMMMMMKMMMRLFLRSTPPRFDSTQMKNVAFVALRLFLCLDNTCTRVGAREKKNYSPS
jgi:hypothetical protein